MSKKITDLFDLSVEQVAHDLAVFRLHKLSDDRTATPNDVLKEYLEGVEIFKKSLDA